MSRRIWGICLSLFAVCVIAAVSFWYFGKEAPTPPESQRGTELVEVSPEEPGTEQVSSISGTLQGPAPAVEQEMEEPEEDYRFLLVDNNDYVTVYRLPENEVYEYTDVVLETLPPDLQEEIRQGKFLRNEEELYNFLENYTS